MELPQPFLFLTCPFSNLGNFETKNQNEPLCVPHWRSKGVHQGCDCLLQATWSGEESWSFLMGSYHHYTIQMDVFFVWVLFTCWLGPDMKAILGIAPIFTFSRNMTSGKTYLGTPVTQE